jgi:uncharacterized protein
MRQVPSVSGAHDATATDLRRRSGVSVVSAHCLIAARRWLGCAAVLLWLAGAALAADLGELVAAVPNPRAENRSWVADPAGAIRARHADLDALIGQFERETGVEIAVVVLPTIGPFGPREFASALFNRWGVGKKGRDNGILVLQVLDQRRIEIEVGYGLEGSLPDVKCRWIIDDIAVPFFRQGSFADGHYEVVRALIAGVRDPAADRQQLTGGVTRVPGARVDPPPVPYRLPGLPESPPSARDASSPLGTIALVVLAGGLGLLTAFAFVVRRHRLGHPDLRAQWTHLRSRSWLVHAGMALTVLAGVAWEFLRLDSVWSTLLLGPGGLLSLRYVRGRLRRLRDQPRVDPKTGEVMRRLDEQADDAYLKAGQIAEERIGSKDYDVWISPSGYCLIEDYDGASRADPCPACHFLTYRRTGVRVLVEPTRSTDGLAEDTYLCAACGHSRVTRRTLAALSGDSDSSGGSFGGSFGGSSGGGGAGRTY